MTIEINVCWYDKTCGWFERHSDNIKSIFFLLFLIGSVPSAIIGWSRFFNINQFFNMGNQIFNEGMTAILSLYGLVSIFDLLYLIAILVDLNEEHHWFALKHCENKVKEYT